MSNRDERCAAGSRDLGSFVVAIVSDHMPHTPHLWLRVPYMLLGLVSIAVGSGLYINDLQQAFITYDAAQCGFCTPGQLMAAHDLLARQPAPSEPEIVAAMSGNLCRCGTYPKIVRAIQAVAAARRHASAADAAPGVPRGA